MTNPNPIQFAFIKAERPSLAIELRYPFAAMAPGGDALLIKNRHYNAVVSAIRTFMKKNPNTYFSASVVDAGAIVWRWKTENQFTIKPKAVKRTQVKKVAPLVAVAKTVESKPVRGRKKTLVVTAKEIMAQTEERDARSVFVRKTGTGIITTEVILGLANNDKLTVAEISQRCNISEGTVKRALQTEIPLV